MEPERLEGRWKGREREQLWNRQREFSTNPPEKCLMLRLMTACAAGIGERFAGFGNKLPVVTLGVKRQLQNTIGVVVSTLTVWLGLTNGTVRLFPAGDDHVLLHSEAWSSISVRLLGTVTS